MGEKHGKCKEYDNNGRLIFDGEYSHGKKHGNCKEYNNKGKLIFVGEYKDGERLKNKCFII